MESGRNENGEHPKEKAEKVLKEKERPVINNIIELISIKKKSKE